MTWLFKRLRPHIICKVPCQCICRIIVLNTVSQHLQPWKTSGTAQGWQSCRTTGITTIFRYNSISHCYHCNRIKAVNLKKNTVASSKSFGLCNVHFHAEVRCFQQFLNIAQQDLRKGGKSVVSVMGVFLFSRKSAKCWLRLVLVKLTNWRCPVDSSKQPH